MRSGCREKKANKDQSRKGINKKTIEDPEIRPRRSAKKRISSKRGQDRVRSKKEFRGGESLKEKG